MTEPEKSKPEKTKRKNQPKRSSAGYNLVIGLLAVVLVGMVGFYVVTRQPSPSYVTYGDDMRGTITASTQMIQTSWWAGQIAQMRRFSFDRTDAMTMNLLEENRWSTPGVQMVSYSTRFNHDTIVSVDANGLTQLAEGNILNRQIEGTRAAQFDVTGSTRIIAFPTQLEILHLVQNVRRPLYNFNNITALYLNTSGVGRMAVVESDVIVRVVSRGSEPLPVLGTITVNEPIMDITFTTQGNAVIAHAQRIVFYDATFNAYKTLDVPASAGRIRDLDIPLQEKSLAVATSRQVLYWLIPDGLTGDALMQGGLGVPGLQPLALDYFLQQENRIAVLYNNAGVRIWDITTGRVVSAID